MARSCVAEFVHTLHNGVEGSVVPDGRVGSPKVIVNGTGNTDDGDVIFLCKKPCASESTITTDDDQGIYLLTLEGIISSFSTFRGLELITTGRFEDRTTALDNSTHVLGSKLLHFTVHEAFITSEDSLYTNVISDCGASHGTNRSIHSRSIPT